MSNQASDRWRLKIEQGQGRVGCLSDQIALRCDKPADKEVSIAPLAGQLVNLPFSTSGWHGVDMSWISTYCRFLQVTPLGS